MLTKKGYLYLIPTHLAEDTAHRYLTAHLLQVVNSICTYIVENEKTARKFLKEIGSSIPQNELILYPYGKHQQENPLEEVFQLLENGTSVGLMSEAGCPAIADPGADIVAQAHRRNIQVLPLVGASSIFMALMSSGFNGQSFSFWGYLPIDKANRKRKIKELETLAERYHQTQIFIETPFRNQQLLDELLNTCAPSTRLCIAKNITANNEWIKSATIAQWKNIVSDLHKTPAIFLLFRG